MIVKIQQSLFTLGGARRMLVYDQFRQYHQELPLTQQVSDLLGGAPKGYFHAELLPSGELQFCGRAPDQNW